MSGVLDLDAWIWAYEEPSGDSDKQWLVDPVAEKGWLFKPLKPGRSPDEAASEYVASRIARALEVPAARVELGHRGGVHGCVSQNVVTDSTHGLVDGAAFIGALEDGYDPKDRQSRGHSILNIVSILRELDPPSTATAGRSALSTFAGYLILDALIGNTDRHSKNWAVETTLTDRDRLAPSFDHATSLGITTRGKKRQELLDQPDLVAPFARKATAHRFEGGRSMSLVSLAVGFLRDHAHQHIDPWRDRIQELNLAHIDDVIEDSLMSAPAATLARNILRVNAERITKCLMSL